MDTGSPYDGSVCGVFLFRLLVSRPPETAELPAGPIQALPRHVILHQVRFSLGWGDKYIIYCMNVVRMLCYMYMYVCTLYACAYKVHTYSQNEFQLQ